MYKCPILVSSAACGANLPAQKAARELGIERHMIFPIGREKFRRTSVTDRPDNWGKLFDGIFDEVEREGNLIVLEGFEDDKESAYSAVMAEILKHAENIADGERKCFSRSRSKSADLLTAE